MLDSKTRSERTFTIMHLEYTATYSKYAALYPATGSNKQFYYKFIKGKCVNEVMGINKIGKMPCLKAKFLKLPDGKVITKK